MVTGEIVRVASTAIVAPLPRVLSYSPLNRRSVRPAKKWQPPEGISPADCKAVIAAAACERDRLLLRVLWATGGRISEVLALRGCDVRRDCLVMVNLKNPSQRVKTVYLSAGDADLPGELLLWQQERGLATDAYLFPSRQGPQLSSNQAWQIVKDASRRAGVGVLAMRPSKDGEAGQPAPVHPHIFRHARVRQIVRSTKSLPLAQKQAGWSRLQMAYLTIGDEEARAMMGGMAE